MFERCLGGVRKVFGRYLGVFDGFYEGFGRCLGGV